MENLFNNVGIIILAAGKGTRLNCNAKPKVLYSIGGKPILSYILEELKKNKIKKNQIYLVVGFKAEQVKDTFGPGYNYVMQRQRRGTAHAAHKGEIAMTPRHDTMLVLNGDDTAFYTYNSLANFVESHKTSNCDISLLTCEPRDPQGLGRVVRDKDGKMVAVVEKENMKKIHHKIREISTGTFCFKRNWFRKYYQTLSPIPNLGELGLPSFIDIAFRTESKVQAVKLKNPNEWFGINTPEQLKEADKRKRA
jgi:bifunctional UDP-N-acetylglucosamine pyrophosphorylase/glucosamine-1-phosphate N-acetyltransferase